MKEQKTFQQFKEVLHSPKTEASYEEGTKYVVGDPDEFCSLAIRNPEEAEAKLVAFIVEKRKTVAPSTIINPVMAVRSFLDWAGAKGVNWDNVNKSLPASQKVADDRPPRLLEIQSLLAVSSQKLRVAVLFLAGGGFRVGAFEYPLPDKTFAFMRLGDVAAIDYAAGTGEVPMPEWMMKEKFTETTILKLHIYAGTPDHYRTFEHPEAAAEFRAYLHSRTLAGEEMEPDNPVLRNDWNWEAANVNARKVVKHRLANPRFPLPMKEKSLQNEICVGWMKAGVRSNTGKRQEFQQVHGFRKYFETEANRVVGTRLDADNNITPMDIEALKGKKKHYNKPTEYLQSVYLVAMPRLYITEAWRGKLVIARKDEQIAATKEQDERYHQKLELKNLVLEKQVREEKEELDGVKERMLRLERALKLEEEGKLHR